MEVSSFTWESYGSVGINLYLHRGGTYKGDEAQLLQGLSLLITIGLALGFDVEARSEVEWGKVGREEIELWNNEEMNRIEYLRYTMTKACGVGDAEAIYVTVLPTFLYHEGKLYERPVFRVSAKESSGFRYIDHAGNTHKSFEDWKKIFIDTPPFHKIMYPQGLKLEKDASSGGAKINTTLTSAFSQTTEVFNFVGKWGKTLGTVLKFVGGFFVKDEDLLNKVTTLGQNMDNVCTVSSMVGQGVSIADSVHHGDYSAAKAQAWGIIGDGIGYVIRGPASKVTTGIFGEGVTEAVSLGLKHVNDGYTVYKMIQKYHTESLKKAKVEEVIGEGLKRSFWLKEEYVFKRV